MIFGEARVEDMSSQMQANAAQKFATQEPAASAGAAAPAAKAAPAVVEDVVDETGIEPKDIELVMQQANVSRAAAVKALRKHDNDMINAIMELSM